MPAFDDEDKEFTPKRKIGLKQTSADAAEKKPDPSANFQERAQEAFDKSEDLKQRIWDLSSKFKRILENSVLLENKTHLQVSAEKEVIDDLVKLALEMNQDESQPEGIGSVMLSTLLIKVMISQRDLINKLSHDLHLQKNKYNVSSD